MIELDGKKIRELFSSIDKEMIDYSVEEALVDVFGRNMVSIIDVQLKHETSEIIVVEAIIKNKRLLI